MASYDPERHHRRSKRLLGYDYRSPGSYFVTLTMQRRRPLFGAIHGGVLLLSAAGAMLAEHWQALPARFPTMALDEWVVMPDHMHGIVVLRDGTAQAAPALGAIIGAFKSLTTNAYIAGVRAQGWPAFEGRLWQRDYYERIVRDEAALRAIRAYIERNPQRWKH